MCAAVSLAVASANEPLPLTSAQSAAAAAGFLNGVNFGGHFLMETSWMYDQVMVSRLLSLSVASLVFRLKGHALIHSTPSS